MTEDSKTLAILGAGKLGTVLAQLALRAGYAVYISGSGSPDKIRLSINVLAPGAHVASSEDAAKHGDIVILAMPLSKFHFVPKEALSGKLVIDAMNYWWEVDGDSEELRNPETSTSEIVQSYFDESRIVKSFSHMGYHHLLDGAKPSGDRNRKAIAIAGDNDADNKTVAGLVDDLGFDPLITDKLSMGKWLQPGNPAFGANVDSMALASLVASSSPS